MDTGNENATVDQVNLVANEILASMQALSGRLDVLEATFEKRLAALEGQRNSDSD